MKKEVWRGKNKQYKIVKWLEPEQIWKAFNSKRNLAILEVIKTDLPMTLKSIRRELEPFPLNNSASNISDALDDLELQELVKETKDGYLLTELGIRIREGARNILNHRVENKVELHNKVQSKVWEIINKKVYKYNKN